MPFASPKKRSQVTLTLPPASPKKPYCGSPPLPPWLQEWVETEHLKQFEQEQCLISQTVSVKSMADYAKQRGLSDHRDIQDRCEIVRLVAKKTSSPVKNPMVPLVMLSHHNVTGAASMKPGRHLAFLTPSKAFRKLVGMEFFHVAIRGVAHEATERETARYLGRYNVHHPKRSLSYEEYQMLPADHRRLATNYARAMEGDPDGDRLSDEDLDKMFCTGKYKMRLLLLEFAGFSRQFYEGLLNRDASTPRSVKAASKKSPNWSKIHAEEIKSRANSTMDSK